jgi:hypothetical protein
LVIYSTGRYRKQSNVRGKARRNSKANVSKERRRKVVLQMRFLRKVKSRARRRSARDKRFKFMNIVIVDRGGRMIFNLNPEKLINLR